MPRTFIEGQVYTDRDGSPTLCRRRYFGGELGTLELVELACTDDRLWLENGKSVAVITRTARAAVRVSHPPVMETLGGCFRPDLCDHYSIEKCGPDMVTANAGPFAGHVCCALCGAPPGAFPRPDSALSAGGGP